MAPQLRQWFTGFFNSVKPLNPERFGDPLALQTKWTSMATSNATFNTHCLTRASPYRYEFRATMALKLFFALFICIGGGMLIGGILFNQDILSNQSIGVGLMGLIFVGAGLFFLLLGTQPIVFDQQSGFFWKGENLENTFIANYQARNQGFHLQTRLSDRAKPWFLHLGSLLANKSGTAKHVVRLDTIYALQLLRVADTESGQNYELNLVLHDAERIHVVVYAKRETIYHDANVLAAFLDRPVWDGIA